MYFNPRSHEGSDDGKKQIAEYRPDFNPRSHEGSDLSAQFVCLDLLYFNPRSHEGSDSGDYVASCLAYKFQSTLPRGERQI